MENRIKRIEILVIITLVLSLFTLFRSFLPEKQIQPAVESEESRPLPAGITRELLDNTAREIKESYNQADWIRLHNVFGDFAQVQIKAEEIEREFLKLIPITGNIETYVYSHDIYSGKNDNADWYNVFYKCRFKNGKGTIKITLRTVDSVSEITGININLDGL
ncbi:MAG: hypothetical protein ABF257_09930 [Polaribacter sp.]